MASCGALGWVMGRPVASCGVLGWVTGRPVASCGVLGWVTGRQEVEGVCPERAAVWTEL